MPMSPGDLYFIRKMFSGYAAILYWKSRLYARLTPAVRYKGTTRNYVRYKSDAKGIKFSTTAIGCQEEWRDGEKTKKDEE